MKRSELFFIVIYFFGIHSLFAQSETGTYLRFKPAVVFGASEVKVNGSQSQNEMRAGWGLGMDVAFIPSEHLLISAGTSLNNRGYKYVRSTYLDFPVSINFRGGERDYFFYNQRIIIGAGIYGGVAIAGHYKNSIGEWVSMQFGESKTDNRSRFDGGFLFNLGLADNDMGTLTLNAMLGRNNVIPNSRQSGDDYIRLNSLHIIWEIPLK